MPIVILVGNIVPKNKGLSGIAKKMSFFPASQSILGVEGNHSDWVTGLATFTQHSLDYLVSPLLEVVS